MDPVEAPAAESPGSLLRAARERRGLSLADVAAALRFAERHVRAAESDRFADLPPQPYGRGLLASYAVLVGLDPAEVLRLWRKAASEDASAARRRIFREPHRDRTTWRDWTVPIGFGVALVLLAAVRGSMTTVPAPLPDPPPPAARPEPSPPAPVSVAPAEAGPAESVPAPGVRLLLRAERETWAEAAIDGGDRVRHDLAPGENLLLAAGDRVRLTLGDAGVVRLRVNERELGFVGLKGERKESLLFQALRGTPPGTPPGAAPAAAPGAGD